MRTFRSASYWHVVLLVLASVLVIACAEVESPLVPTEVPLPTPTAQPSSGRGVGGTLRLLYWQAPKNLNPHLSLESKELEPARMTYEPLASFDKTARLVPFLAAEIPSLENGGVAKDGKSVTWKLRRDVRWSDGYPFTAADVRFTYQFITNPEVGAASRDTYADVQNVEIIDEYTIKVWFKDVNPAWSLPFVGSQGMILPQHIFQPFANSSARRAPANLHPVGTGPYRVVDFKTEEVLFLGTELIQTERIIFEPNPYFREQDKPYFSRVEVKGGATASEAALEVLQTADYDFAWNVRGDAETLVNLERLGKGIILPNLVPYVERIQLNRTDPNKSSASGEFSSLQLPHPFFSDKRVRQAFAYAIDRAAIARLYQDSQPTNNNLVLPERYASSKLHYTFDPSKASALLDEAGWIDHDGDGFRDKDGIRMRVVYQTTANNPARQQTQELVHDMLRDIGVDVDLHLVDARDFFDNDPSNTSSFRQFRADMQQFSDGNQNPDPGAYMKYWTCAQIPQRANGWNGENAERWCNPTYDALYQQSLRETDPQRRQQLFIQMNDMLIDDVVMIPLVHTAELATVSRAITGVDLTPWDAYVWNIKDWKRSTP